MIGESNYSSYAKTYKLTQNEFTNLDSNFVAKFNTRKIISEIQNKSNEKLFDLENALKKDGQKFNPNNKEHQKLLTNEIDSLNYYVDFHKKIKSFRK